MYSLKLFILLFSCLTFALPLYIDGSAKSCSAEQVSNMKGKCGKYVNDLTSLTERGGKGDQYGRNISETCQSITNCYAGIKCTESQDQKIIYDQKCEKLNFNNHNISDCIERFYGVVYQGKDSCVNKFNYFSKDMRIKRGAYTSGKSCLVDFAKKNCSNSAIDYLNSDYERFLEIMTTPSEDEKCESLHDELMGRQCDPELKEVLIDALTTKLAEMMASQKNNSIAEKCISVKGCLSNYCYFNATAIEKVDEICDFAVNSTIKTTTFDACYAKISMDVDASKYECIGHTPSNSTSPMGFMMATLKIVMFLDNKDCVKTVMKGECEPSALVNFEEGWKEAEKKKKDLRMELDMDLDKLII